MKLSQIYEGKRVCLTDIDGDVFEGVVGDYIYPEDNEPEGVDAIVLDCATKNGWYEYKNPVQFNANEIESIEIV